MEYIDGLIYKNNALPELSSEHRCQIYSSVIKVFSRHSFNWRFLQASRKWKILIWCLIGFIEQLGSSWSKFLRSAMVDLVATIPKGVGCYEKCPKRADEATWRMVETHVPVWDQQGHYVPLQQQTETGDSTALPHTFLVLDWSMATFDRAISYFQTILPALQCCLQYSIGSYVPSVTHCLIYLISPSRTTCLPWASFVISHCFKPCKPFQNQYSILWDIHPPFPGTS